MELARNLGLIVHFLGLAMILGPFFVSTKTCPTHDPAARLHEPEIDDCGGCEHHATLPGQTKKIKRQRQERFGREPGNLHLPSNEWK